MDSTEGKIKIWPDGFFWTSGNHSGDEHFFNARSNIRKQIDGKWVLVPFLHSVRIANWKSTLLHDVALMGAMKKCFMAAYREQFSPTSGVIDKFQGSEKERIELILQQKPAGE